MCSLIPSSCLWLLSFEAGFRKWWSVIMSWIAAQVTFCQVHKFTMSPFARRAGATSQFIVLSAPLNLSQANDFEVSRTWMFIMDNVYTGVLVKFWYELMESSKENHEKSCFPMVHLLLPLRLIANSYFGSWKPFSRADKSENTWSWTLGWSSSNSILADLHYAPQTPKDIPESAQGHLPPIQK